MTHPFYSSPILVTGAAGFVGYHTVKALIARGATQVIGIDNLNSYYDPALKQARLAELARLGSAFRFMEVDVADRAGMEALFTETALASIIH